MSGEAGWWGCVSCKARVGNDHTGACSRCGGRIGRVVPAEAQLNLDFGIVLPRREVQPPRVEEAPRDWTNVALVAAMVSCFATPLLGASSAGWSAVAVIMALNIWSSSISYYALALVGRREHQEPLVESPAFQPFKLAPELYQPNQLPRRRAA